LIQTPDAEFEKTLSEKDNPEIILENLSDGIIAHDRNHLIIFLNRMGSSPSKSSFIP